MKKKTIDLMLTGYAEKEHSHWGSDRERLERMKWHMHHDVSYMYTKKEENNGEVLQQSED